ncbi:MAG TPA: LysM peptidoglycan-binding domain-containing protein [Syntrophales bacterium]|nr:LysM peptidoglycan-binding domain-containing protein [Syntrophales bacterium]
MRKRQICLWASLIFFCLPVLIASPLHAAEQYRVKSGDSLHKIAKKCNVSVDALKKANHLESAALKPNQVLVIPGRPSDKAAAKNVGKKKSSPDASVYVVKKGETLAVVSERTGVPASEIRQMNELRSSKLKSGQKLILQTAPAGAGEDEDDLEEAGSIEAGELAAAGESPDRSNGIVPLELSRWKGPGERDLFVKIVKSYEGVPYKMGGNSIRGIDCSAFTRKVYGIFSVDLPRTAREQLQCGKRVGRDDLDVGDLVFFQTRRSRIHVGIFLGGNEFFHLSSRNRAGKVDNLESPYFNSRFISGVRVKETGQHLKAENPLPSLKQEEKPPVSVRHVPHSPGG